MHRAHPTPGLPPGQTVLPYAPIGPAPMGAHAWQAARRAVAALHANLQQLCACARHAPRGLGISGAGAC
eukprot:307673-Chlamydomonas_euryale.AAC.1